MPTKSSLSELSDDFLADDQDWSLMMAAGVLAQVEIWWSSDDLLMVGRPHLLSYDKSEVMEDTPFLE